MTPSPTFPWIFSQCVRALSNCFVNDCAFRGLLALTSHTIWNGGCASIGENSKSGLSDGAAWLGRSLRLTFQYPLTCFGWSSHVSSEATTTSMANPLLNPRRLLIFLLGASLPLPLPLSLPLRAIRLSSSNLLSGSNRSRWTAPPRTSRKWGRSRASSMSQSWTKVKSGFQSFSFRMVI